MTHTVSEEPGARGASRRQFLGIAAMIAAGLSAAEILGRPLPATAAVQWFHPFTTRGNMTSPYGPRTNPVTGEYKLHDGIDYNPPDAGTPVRVVADGTVAEVLASSTGYGTSVRVSHADGYETLYGHLQAGSVRVRRNEAIGASTVVGLLGNTGQSTAAHLHLLMHRNNQSIDPAPLVDRAPLALSTPTTPAPPKGNNMQLIRVICDANSGQNGNAEYGSTAIITESVGFVRTSTGLGSRAELEAWTAVANALGIPVTEKHVDVNGYLLSQRF